jgi:superfamily I DNA and/or RNA helicase
MELQVQVEELPDWTDERLLGLDLLFDENSYREMKFAIGKVRTAEDKSNAGRLRNVLLGYQQAGFSEKPASPEATALLQKLNDSQRNAVLKMLQAEDAFVLHGPPGTGKTTTLVAAVQAALCGSPQVMVCAPSNAAADLLTERLAAAGVKVLRIGNPARISEEILPFTVDHLIAGHADAKEIKRLRKLAYELKRMAFSYKKYYDRSEREQKQAMLKEARSILQQIAHMEQYVMDGARDKTQAFVCTLVGASNVLLKGKEFEWVFIDEAGQALEPSSWIPVLKAKRLVMAGDHCQLPPTVKSREAARQGFEQTLMEKFLERSGTAGRAMLETQYRSHASIMAFSSDYFYEGKLQPWQGVEGKLLWNQPEDGNAPLVFIDTAGTGFEERFHPESAGLSNPGEAALLIRHLREWLAQNLPKVNGQLHVAVISPYREQVERLKMDCSGLEKSFSGKVKIRCGTVDGFQGQEADVVYISLVRSNERSEIGFLRDIRRMNVAVTRAKMRLVLIGDSATISGFGFYNELLDFLGRSALYQSAWEFPE